MLAEYITVDVAGEKIRSNIVDGQKGLPLTVDIQVIDVTTCDPVADAYLEIWSKFDVISRKSSRNLTYKRTQAAIPPASTAAWWPMETASV
jgi:hypothetical protein